MSKLVEFTITCDSNTNPKNIESRLKQLANDLSLKQVQFKRLKSIQFEGTTSQKTYEDLFGGKLEYKHEQWEEVEPAKSPKGFEGEIIDVRVNREYQVLN